MKWHDRLLNIVAIVMAFQLITFDHGTSDARRREDLAHEWTEQQVQQQIAEASAATITPETTLSPTTTQPVTTTTPSTVPETTRIPVSADAPATTGGTSTIATTTTQPVTTTTLPPRPAALTQGIIAESELFGWLTVEGQNRIQQKGLFEGEDADDPKLLDKFGLDHGVAHRLSTAFPGSGGNVVISGHRTSNSKDVFRDINELQVGQVIQVGITKPGYVGVYTYEVEQITGMILNDGTIANRYFTQQRPYETLSLMACDPPGSTTHRIIVLARLIMIDGVRV